MIGPSRMSYDIARSRHQEHLSHASRIREIQQARRDGTLTPDRTTHRRQTAARLLAVATALRASLHL
jgi:hypothetical protein